MMPLARASRVDPGTHGVMMGAMNKVNLAEKLALFSEYWKPKVVGELNGQQVKLVKFKGAFTWHHHDTEDEMFLVVKGRLRMELRDRSVELDEGEFIVIPKGVEHRPVAWRTRGSARRRRAGRRQGRPSGNASAGPRRQGHAARLAAHAPLAPGEPPCLARDPALH